LDDLIKQVNDFIADQARWSLGSQDSESALEKTFEKLELKVSKFEEKPLAHTKAAFNDLAESIQTYLSKQTPSHLSDRQIVFENKFADLSERLILAKQVLTQRTAINAYLKQADVVEEEGETLRSQLISAEENGES